MNPKANFLAVGIQVERARARRWRIATLSTTAYAIAAIGAATLLWVTTPALPILAGAASLQDELSKRQVRLAKVRAELNTLERRLEALASVGNGIDANALTTVVAQAVGSEISLSALRLSEPQKSEGGLRRSLELDGVSQTVGDATKLALRLEGLGVFDSVSLGQTSREPTATVEAVRFQITCQMPAEIP